MRLLVLTYRFPSRSDDAACNTVAHLVRYFGTRHDVSLVSLAPSAEEAARVHLVEPYCRRIETVVLPKWQSAARASWRGLFGGAPMQVPFYHSPELHARVSRVIAEERIDIAYGYHLRSGQYLRGITGIPRCLAIQPAQVLHFGRRTQHIRNPIRRLVYQMEHRRLQGYERAVAADFDRCLLISETDRRAIDPEGSLGNVFFNPHGVDTDAFAPPPDAAKEPGAIVFSGAMSIDTNSDAILYFCRDIYPLVKAKFPGVRLYVVGKQPPASVRALAADPSIAVTGYVEDLRPYLWKAQVAIDPLRIGAGLQNKILEAMAAGLPVVATAVANEGIGAAPEREIAIADDPRAFADSVVRLLGDARERARLGAAGRGLVERQWSWEAYFAPLEQLFESLVAPRTSAKPAVAAASGALL